MKKTYRLHIDEKHERNETGSLISDDVTCGSYDIAVSDDTVFLTIFCDTKEDMFHHLAVLCERIIVGYLPKRIVISISDDHEEAFIANGFVKENDVYVKEVEPYRSILENSVFDAEGYIIHQGKMNNIPFGSYNTSEKGCGWIAAYNLLKMCGREKKMETIVKDLNSSLFRKKFGQSITSLARYLKKEIPACHQSRITGKDAVIRMKESRCGILLYVHKHGVHYVAYRNLEDGTMQFYNAVYGKRNHIETPEEFFERYVLVPIAHVIYVL